MYTTGLLSNGHGGYIPLSTVLMDSGSVVTSVVNKRLLDTFSEELDIEVSPANMLLTLADAETPIRIDKIATLNLLFRDHSGAPHRMHLRCAVMKTGPDIIIGLPDILNQAFELFINMLLYARQQIKLSRSPTLSVLDVPPEQMVGSQQRLLLRAPAVRDPFALRCQHLPAWDSLLADAPEESSIPEAAAFPDALHHLDTTIADRKQQYHEDLKTVVVPELQDDLAFMAWLREDAIRVFISNNWTGIKGVDPIYIQTTPDLPANMPCSVRPIAPKLFAAAKAECERLMSYLWAKSTSSRVSPLVVAPKATHPFIRICGDYVKVNVHILSEHYPIPHILNAIVAVAGSQYYAEFDMANSFHQIRLHPDSSALLSVKTPWGVFQPLFLPEGVKMASSKLQEYVSAIFHDFTWAIIIFDNFLIHANTLPELQTRIRLFIDRCAAHNLFLKITKSKFGVQSLKFFGYSLSGRGYGIDDERRAAIMAVPFPSSGTPEAKRTRVRQFMGLAGYFRNFVKDHAIKAAHLTNMTSLSFDWNPSTWAHDYHAIWEAFKRDCFDAFDLIHPDMSLEWIAMVDASMFGWGGVVVQVRITPDGRQLEPIICISGKYSPVAQRWDTPKSECYAMYKVVEQSAYYLRHKEFSIMTDHRNLQWLVSTQIPSMIRIRLFLQGFPIKGIYHIKGTDNKAADALSRMYESSDGQLDPLPAATPLPTSPPTDDSLLQLPLHDPTSDLCALHGCLYSFLDHPEKKGGETREDASVSPETPTTVDQSDWIPMVLRAHAGGSIHRGKGSTWRLLRKLHPNHLIPFSFVCEVIDACALCQKFRLNNPKNRLPELPRNLKVSHLFARIGGDGVDISPPDADGNCYIWVLKNMFAGIVFFYPSNSKDAESCADAMVAFIAIYGLFEEVLTDPGSSYTAEALQLLSKYMGYQHKFSLVDRHQSNGVERTNGLLIGMLQTICAEEDLASKWGKPRVLQRIAAYINSTLSTEYGPYSPHQVMFGTGTLAKDFLPSLGAIPIDQRAMLSNAYIKTLNEELEAIRRGAHRYQQALIAKRYQIQNTPQIPWSPGDLVLVDNDAGKDNKLQAAKLGPYKVIRQVNNDVSLQHLLTGAVKDVHVTKLSLFDGSLEDAKTLVMLDRGDYVVSAVIAFRGDENIRSTCEVLVRWAIDQSETWQLLTKDLQDTAAFEEFCQRDPCLRQLLVSAAEAKRIDVELRAQAITPTLVGTDCYVNLRWVSRTLGLIYKELPLDDVFGTNYLVRMQYREISGTVPRQRILLYDPVFDCTHKVGMDFVIKYGYMTDPSASLFPVVLVTKDFVRAHPCLTQPPDVAHITSSASPFHSNSIPDGEKTCYHRRRTVRFADASLIYEPP